MQYISTRGQASELTFTDVLLDGLARDGGLYVPKTWPQIPRDDIAGFAGQSYAQVAARVMQPLVGDSDPKAFQRLCQAAYAKFEHAAVTPLVQISPDTFVLELFHGPTLAFKDLAMQLLAWMMEHALADRKRRAMIVGATSGDTGGAAIEAFRDTTHLDCVILYPAGRVSDVQRRMMTTPTEPNVQAVAVDGTFDDCQALVKALFNDHAFRDEVGLTAINSINWARIAAQIVYYFVAAVALGAPYRKVSFVVPTGNFGDIFAGYAARAMGLPIDQLVIATNSNDILARARATGRYEMRGVQATTSPSMDIEISSNFERYLFEAQGRDGARVRAQMASLRQARGFDLGAAHARLQADFDAASASEGEVSLAIRSTLVNCGMTLDPHTACAQVALDKTRRGSGPYLLLATASPAKFPDTMEAITGRRPALPARLSRLLTEPERITQLPNDLSAVQALVRAQARRAS